MKKSILTVLVALVLVFACALPAAATDTVSEDPAVQATYEAYLAMETAYDNGDFEAMRAARADFWDSQEEYTEEQTAEWENIVTNTIGQEKYDTVTIDASWLDDRFEPEYSAFKANKTAHNAYYYVTVYDYMDWIDVNKFFADASALYDEAKPLVPTSADVIKIYEVYEDMMFWFLNEGVDNGFFEDYYKEFEGLLEVYNEFTNEELTELAGMLEVEDAEAAFNKILGDWIVINVAVEIDKRADVFGENYDVDAAKEFVEYYESIVESDMFTEEQLELIIYRNYMDSVYEEALWAIEKAEDADKQDATTEGSDKSDKDTSPATGDDFNAAPYAALMVIAAAVAAMAVKRRKIQ